MATMGLKYPVYAPLTEIGNAATHANGAVAGKGISVTASYETADAKLFADDRLAESDNSFKSGTLNVNIYDMTMGTRAKLMGHTPITPESGSAVTGFIGGGADFAPYVGFGFYGRATGKKWRAIWYPKVKFAEPNDEMETKGDNTVYKTPTLIGTISEDVSGEWIYVQEFTTEAAAKAFLDTKAGITEVS